MRELNRDIQKCHFFIIKKENKNIVVPYVSRNENPRKSFFFLPKVVIFTEIFNLPWSVVPYSKDINFNLRPTNYMLIFFIINSTKVVGKFSSSLN